ncbi:DM13 domain-containing protein [Streptomyces sp. SAJ15]|uniref:DM13 domain-containing protein n=1 Tax=Streptomyces sp. SAJ15 TaxID=2011095 RepID=UPI001185D23D|nr:DM13 domain-containing protein [Streptomyces sp. SAJ15]TVL90442.1 electron transporter [Streptomyces sp. SAJ15]
MTRRIRTRLSRRVVIPVLLAVTVVAGVGLYLFQPWKAFIDTEVNEALPTPARSAVEDGAAHKDPAGSSRAPGGLEELATGGFVSHEHGTSGTARTLRLTDGSRVLRLEDLNTSDGPDVRVYLSPRDADAAESGLGEGAVELGKLKGNIGNQNYTVPAGTDLSAFHSAVIWCKRFSVSFGAADLTQAAG